MTAELPTFSFGDPVRFATHLRRTSRYDDKTRVWVKRWEPCPSFQQPHPLHGLIVGRRTLHNGHNEGGGYDDPIVFVSKHRFTAYLVAYAMHRVPVLVRPEDLTPLTCTTQEELL